ncbi:hypothetical protein SK128_000772, partial [Halocaridina rubra]
EPKKLKRGEPISADEVVSWSEASGFPNLNRRGQEAFFKFLRGGNYEEEDKEIEEIDLTADGMSNNARRYQFWLKCRNMNLESLFGDYILDDEVKLDDAQESFKKLQDKQGADQIKDITELQGKARVLDTYLGILKESMAPDLNTEFLTFRESLKKLIKK